MITMEHAHEWNGCCGLEEAGDPGMLFHVLQRVEGCAECQLAKGIEGGPIVPLAHVLWLA